MSNTSCFEVASSISAAQTIRINFTKDTAKTFVHIVTLNNIQVVIGTNSVPNDKTRQSVLCRTKRLYKGIIFLA